jgi:nitrogen fixation-related uncharacterized protein
MHLTFTPTEQQLLLPAAITLATIILGAIAVWWGKTAKPYLDAQVQGIKNDQEKQAAEMAVAAVDQLVKMLLADGQATVTNEQKNAMAVDIQKGWGNDNPDPNLIEAAVGRQNAIKAAPPVAAQAIAEAPAK